MKRTLTCIVCPLGCTLEAEIKDGCVTVSGNTCKRGAVYAESECIAPKRVITSTVRSKSGKLVSVKTDAPIPKEKITACMNLINAASCDLPIAVGDVIIENVFGSNLVATSNVSE